MRLIYDFRPFSFLYISCPCWPGWWSVAVARAASDRWSVRQKSYASPPGSAALQMQCSPCCRCASDAAPAVQAHESSCGNSQWPSPCVLCSVRKGPMLSCRAVLRCIPAKFISHLAATMTYDGGGLERAGLRMVRLSC
jgi:hypothetical protein